MELYKPFDYNKKPQNLYYDLGFAVCEILENNYDAEAFILSNTSITSLTAVAEASNNAFSSLFNCNSIICSIPFLPNLTGTPR